jgi:hypothetical protein
LSNSKDAHPSSLLSEIQDCIAKFDDVSCFSGIAEALRAVSSVVLSPPVSDSPNRPQSSTETTSSDAEVKILRFQYHNLNKNPNNSKKKEKDYL